MVLEAGTSRGTSQLPSAHNGDFNLTRYTPIQRRTTATMANNPSGNYDPYILYSHVTATQPWHNRSQDNARKLTQIELDKPAAQQEAERVR